MKKLYILILILTGATYAGACDFCNCYLGLDPGYNKNTIGLRGNWRTAEWMAGGMNHRITHDTHGGTAPDYNEELKESFFTAELYVRYSPISKLRLMAILPYTFNTLEYGDVNESRSSLSDLTVLAFYQVLNTMPADSVSVRHRLFGGVGVKFPTGKSEGASDVEIPMAHHLYSGTGSTDYLLNVSYIGKYRKLGWNLDLSYKLNGESATHYRYGNTFNATPRVFYEVALKSVKLYPHLGAAYERGEKDEYYDYIQEETDGQMTWGAAGVDIYFGPVSLTTDFRVPVWHDMGAQIPEDRFWLFTSLNVHF